jgi:hypothetical protein
MEELIKSPALQQVPGLVIMAIIVLAFLKYIKTRDAFIAEMHNEVMRARVETRTALEASTLASNGNADATRENTRALLDVRHVVNQLQPKQR